jgi:thiamine biosynthesis lipoprotein
MTEPALMKPVTRRRFLGVSAVAAAAATVPFATRNQPWATFTWRGIALGAEASLTLQHPGEAEAKAAIADCLAEVARLEAIFSLHRPDSALSKLNTSGYLEDAPPDLSLLVSRSLRLARQTNGAFDPTVQPLWALYGDHFSAPGADPDGPAADHIAAARSRVGWDHVRADGTRIVLRKEGMALTLNGIAQGYITDRVGDLLKARGFSHVLVNLGEQLALGPRWDGEAWTAGVASPEAGAPILLRVPMTQGALATSGGYGCRFDEAGRFTHILDPRTGCPARRWASISVTAARATEADGFSTAFYVLTEEQIAAARSDGVRIFAVRDSNGSGRWL